MYLLVDTTPYEGFKLTLFRPKKNGSFFVIEKQFSWATDRLVEAIDKILKSNKVNVKKIKGLAMTPSGSFTAVRTVSVILNTIGLVNNRPLIMLNAGNRVEEAYKKLKDKKRYRPLAPTYSREPNITLGKSKI
jgi:tRNA A37 threonylcarbamoyladenosine modification protein TsaB